MLAVGRLSPAGMQELAVESTTTTMFSSLVIWWLLSISASASIPTAFSVPASVMEE